VPAPVAKVELHPSDFFFGITLGEGAYARVVHAKSKKTNEYFAVKIMEKMHIKKENKVKQVMKERQILSMLSHPFVVKFYFSFQDTGYLYMCMDLAPGGELLSLITLKQNEKIDAGIEEEACDKSMTQFYIAEIVEAIEYLHKKKIVHRDLKPENVLLSATGHVKITDFGTSIISSEDSNSPRTSFVGTQDYVSPEVLSGDKKATKACDLWALGCMIYQMLSGISPFRGGTEYLTFENIMGHCRGTQPLNFPAVIDATTKDIILKLLQTNDVERLGAGEDSDNNGYATLKQHAYFHGTQWDELANKTAPFQPDASHFPTDKNMRDGADEDWLMEGDPTPIQSSRQSDIASMELASPTNNSKWEQFLVAPERRVFTGLIYKRKGLFSKKRQLILTDAPRLLYVDPDTMEYKGEIPWTTEQPVRCIVKNQKEFDVECSVTGRAYHISDPQGGASMWADLINAVLQESRHTSTIRYNSVAP